MLSLSKFAFGWAGKILGKSSCIKVISGYARGVQRQLREELRMELVGVTQLCIAFDGSVRAGVSWEGLVVAFLKNGKMVVRVADVKPMDAQDAKSIADELLSFLADVDFHGSLVVACDNASVNLGVRSGIATRLQKATHNVVAVSGCDAHICNLILNWFCKVRV